MPTELSESAHDGPPFPDETGSYGVAKSPYSRHRPYGKLSAYRKESRNESPSMSSAEFGQNFPQSFRNFRRNEHAAIYLPEPARHEYINRSARPIAESVVCYEPTLDIVEQICDALPGLLEQCAWGIGGQHYSLMMFLVKWKR